jgi:predicted enzyme related to lactoylglutathione lyase
VITAVHALIYNRDAAKTRAFFRDVLGLKHVDAGDGWLIFRLPPAELGIHPVEEMHSGKAPHELYFMCDDVQKTMTELKARGVEFTREVSDEGWGLLTAFKLPEGEEVGLYEPRHPTAFKL